MKLFEKPAPEKYFAVSADIVMDILNVLVNHAIQFEIKSIDMNESSILLYLSSKNQNAYYAKAIENIDVIISEYREYSSLLH